MIHILIKASIIITLYEVLQTSLQGELSEAALWSNKS